jgi:hypothetical protein
MRFAKTLFVLGTALLLASVATQTVFSADGGKPAPQPPVAIADGGKPAPQPPVAIADGGKPAPQPPAFYVIAA